MGNLRACWFLDYRSQPDLCLEVGFQFLCRRDHQHHSQVRLRLDVNDAECPFKKRSGTRQFTRLPGLVGHDCSDRTNAGKSCFSNRPLFVSPMDRRARPKHKMAQCLKARPLCDDPARDRLLRVVPACKPSSLRW